jgi:MFS transporter, MHS family, shikimate and dehydroshikimate transport protein
VSLAVNTQHVTSARSAKNQARHAALGSFVGAVVDWYDFLALGCLLSVLVAAKMKTREDALSKP